MTIVTIYVAAAPIICGCSTNYTTCPGGHFTKFYKGYIFGEVKNVVKDVVVDIFCQQIWGSKQKRLRYALQGQSFLGASYGHLVCNLIGYIAGCLRDHLGGL